MPRAMTPNFETDLLLLGAGHAQLFVLEALESRPDLAARALLVTENERSIYSGMVPGVLEGRYHSDECRIPVARLARRAGIRAIFGRGVELDAADRTLTLADG